MCEKNKKSKMTAAFCAAALSLALGTALTSCGGKSAKAVSDGSYEVATVRWADWGEKYHEGFPDKAAQEAGVKVNWRTILFSDWNDKKAVILAGGDLPDAFLGEICFSESEILANKGLFIPLEGYIEKCMPNLSKILKEDGQMKALATSSDGHIYGLPAKKVLRMKVWNQMFINKTWLDNLGLKMPETYREFEAVLEAFKKYDANKNGNPDDEIPFGAGYADSVMFFCLPFGTTVGTDNTSQMALRDGKVVYLPVTNQYKDGLKWMHECYEKGLIDREIFTEDGSMRDAKLMAKTPVVGCAPGWTADSTFGANSDQYAALPPLAGPDGKRYISSDPDHAGFSRYEFMVTKRCKDVEKLLAWADKFYTEDASIQNFYGSFGIGTQKNDDGTYTVLAPRDGMSADTYAWVSSLRDFGPKYVSDDFNSKIKYEAANGDAIKIKLDEEMRKYAVPAVPNMSYTPDQHEKLRLLYTDINSYARTLQAKWVTEGGIDGEWDSYMQSLNRMGLEKFLEIHNDAYKTYLKNQ